MIILSYTSFSLYKTCAQAFKFKYVDKIKPLIRPNVRFFIEGSAVHKTIEKCLLLSPVLDMEKAVEYYPSIFDEVIVEQKKQGDIRFFHGETMEDIKNNGLNILKSGVKSIKLRKMDEGKYHNEYKIGTYKNAYWLTPVLPIQGSVDWMKEYEDHIELADFKSSKGTEYLSPAQIIMYVLAIEKIFKKPVTRGFYLMLRTGTAVNVNINQMRRDSMLADLVEVNNKIRKGEFKASPSESNCNECSFRNQCEFSKSKKESGQITFGDL